MNSRTIFTTPVSPFVIANVLLADRKVMDILPRSLRNGHFFEKLVGDVLDLLARFRLVLSVRWQNDNRDPKREETRYTAHTMVRKHVLRDPGGLFESPGEPHDFASSCLARRRGDTPRVHRSAHDLVAASWDGILDCLECDELRKRADIKSHSSCTKGRDWCWRTTKARWKPWQWKPRHRHALLRAAYCSGEYA